LKECKNIELRIVAEPENKNKNKKEEKNTQMF